MFMNTYSSYKPLSLFLSDFYYGVPDFLGTWNFTIPQNFHVGEPWQRGISSAWCDTQSHRTPVLSGTCEFQQPRAEAAWGLPCSLTLMLKNPRAACVAQLPWHKLWAAPCPRVPNCKKRLQSDYKLFKEFWELLLKSWVLSVRVERILQCKFPSAFSTWKQLAPLPGETNSRQVKL